MCQDNVSAALVGGRQQDYWARFEQAVDFLQWQVLHHAGTSQTVVAIMAERTPMQIRQPGDPSRRQDWTDFRAHGHSAAITVDGVPGAALSVGPL
jgi:hypothetical protein